jgi:prepilin-type N-terminal cleavage/methylation domain-containing protein
MKPEIKKTCARHDRMGGFSLIELLVVVFVVLVVAAVAVPNVLLAVATFRLRSSAGDLAGLMQQARIMAAKNNPQIPPLYPVRYGVKNGRQIAFVDINNDSSWTSSVTVNGVTFSEPLIEFSGTVVPAAGAPSGSGGQPPAYVLAGDTVIGGSSYDNTHTMAFTPRGFPCDYITSSSPATCSTPAPTYFVYYLTDTRAGGSGWAAVVVTKAGRTKVVDWNGTAWK